MKMAILGKKKLLEKIIFIEFTSWRNSKNFFTTVFMARSSRTYFNVLAAQSKKERVGVKIFYALILKSLSLNTSKEVFRISNTLMKFIFHKNFI